MTELQLKIRRLAHACSTGKKRGKDISAIAAELSDLRAKRKVERSEKASEASKTPEAQTNA